MIVATMRKNFVYILEISEIILSWSTNNDKYYKYTGVFDSNAMFKFKQFLVAVLIY